jgi:hypothetical protein
LAGELITRKIDGKLGTTLGAGEDLKLDKGAANSAARGPEEDSRENQKRNKAFHY